MLKNLEEMISQLEDNDNVLGLVQYGSRLPSDMSHGGDFDLFVFMQNRSDDVESIHFYVGGIPVDLNLRTMEDLQSERPVDNIDHTLLRAEIIFDRTGMLKKEIAALSDRWASRPDKLSEHEVSFQRFSQKHLLDKVKNRLIKEPLLCEFLLSTNIYWLVQNYFRVRLIPFPGEKSALRWLKRNETELYEKIGSFYKSSNLAEKLEISKILTDLVLAPINGPWRAGELIVFGRSHEAADLHVKGMEVFSELFGGRPEDVLSHE
jgi:hypothetical protein